MGLHGVMQKQRASTDVRLVQWCKRGWMTCRHAACTAGGRTWSMTILAPGWMSTCLKALLKSGRYLGLRATLVCSRHNTVCMHCRQLEQTKLSAVLEQGDTLLQGTH